MKFNENKFVLLLVLILAAAAVLTIAANSCKSEDYKDWLRAEGVVTAVGETRKFRVQVHYRYSVGGVSCSDWESLSIRNDSIPSVGDKVSVWYDSKNTVRTSLSRPEVGLLDSIAPVFLVIPLSAAVLLTRAGKGRSAVSRHS